MDIREVLVTCDCIAALKKLFFTRHTESSPKVPSHLPPNHQNHIENFARKQIKTNTKHND